MSRAARSLALALSMDSERASTQLANDRFRVAMADGLHQVKSPLQALRTFGKLLQRQLAEEGMMEGRSTGGGRKLVERLAEDVLAQGERVVDLIEPMDALVHERRLLTGDVVVRKDAKTASSSSIALILQPSGGGGGGQQQQQQQLLPPSMPVLGTFELEMAYPQDMLGSIVYASQAISREGGINFDAVGFEPDNAVIPGVTVCQKHLKEAFSNVLDNAIKYVTHRRRGKKGRPRIPHIRVTLTSNEPPLAAGCTIYVEDNGPGIPAAEIDKVFERGHRGKVQEEVSGSGLGLAIAREMITRMGGMIDFVEGPNGMDGTAVRIILFQEPEA